MGIRSLLSKAVVAFFLGAAKAKLPKAKNTTKMDLMFHSIDTTFSLRNFTGILCSNCHSVCSPWISSTNWFCSCARVSRARSRVHGSHSSSGAILAPCSPQTPLLTGFALRKLKIFWDGGGRRIGALHWANLHLFFCSFSSVKRHDLLLAERRSFDRSIRGCQLSEMLTAASFSSLQGMIQHNNFSWPMKSLSRLRSLNFRLLQTFFNFFFEEKVLQFCNLFIVCLKP